MFVWFVVVFCLVGFVLFLFWLGLLFSFEHFEAKTEGVCAAVGHASHCMTFCLFYLALFHSFYHCTAL